MTTPNPNDEERPEETGWEQGETQELSMREISFRRRPPEQSEVSLPDEAAAPVVPADDAAWTEPARDAVPSEEPAGKVPFYKRELNFRRKREADVVAVPVAVAAQATADEPVASSEDVGGGSHDVHSKPAQSPDAGSTSPVTRPTKSRAPSGRTTVGVKIGASTVSVAIVEQQEGVGQLTALFRRPLIPGIVVDGEVRDQQALAQALSELWAEERLPRRGVRLGLFGSRIGVRPVDIIGIEEADQFSNAVRFKAHEVLPIGVHESVLDFRVLSERVNETGERVRKTLLVVAPRDQVMPYVESFRSARIGLEAVDIDALALMRAFVDPGQPGLVEAQDSASVVVAVDRDGSTLLVAGGGGCEFTRAFDWGGNALAAAVAEQLEQSPEAAWSLLESVARRGAAGKPLEDEDERRAADVVRARVVPFARELVSSLQFYQQQHGSLGISDIVVTGALADVPGLADALHQLIGVSVRVGDPLARLVVRAIMPAGADWTVSSMAVPIGLALRDLPEREVDLVPPDQRVKIKWRPRLAPVLLPAAVAVPVVAMGVLFFQASGNVSDSQSQLDSAQAELASLPKPKAVIDASLSGEAASRASSVASLLGGRLAWNAVFSDLSRVLPNDVWLTSVQAALPDPATTAAVVPGVPTAGPTAVTIQGKTFDYNALADLLTRLSTVPSLSDVQLAQSAFEETTLPGGRTVKVLGFSITAGVDPAGGS
jgi:type IV pilus assembly protein PilM